MDESGNKIDIEIDYPQTVYLVEGNHPEVFSANGSHGTWASEGTVIIGQSIDLWIKSLSVEGICTGMSHRKRREIKQKPSRARSGDSGN